MDYKNFILDNTYLTLPSIFYSRTKPTTVTEPSLVLQNDDLLKDLGWNAIIQYPIENAAYFSGNALPKNLVTISQSYAGHQFGYFTMLGDGRAVLLGELIKPDGKRVDIQLKGAGITKYSRGGDGRATLQSCLREYIISESIHWLGIPSSRSLFVVTTGESVYRNEEHQGAVLTRIMSSHIRIGTFEFARHYGNIDDLKGLLNYTINRHYPEFTDAEISVKPLLFLKAVMIKQIKLISHWMRVGFIHGVMNTDNTGIAGETFDYGPCAFMNYYNPDTFYSSIDTHGRYRYCNQPHILKWNLSVLADALLPLIHKDEKLAIEKVKEILSEFSDLYSNVYYEMMLRKIGIQKMSLNNKILIEDLLQEMQTMQLDYTMVFQDLGSLLNNQNNNPVNISKEWKHRWLKMIGNEQDKREESIRIMNNENPFVIPRNHLIEESINRAIHGDYTMVKDYLNILKKPYHKPSDEKYEKPPVAEFEMNYKTYCGT